MRAVVVDDWELVGAGIRDVLSEQGIETAGLRRRGADGLTDCESSAAELLVLGSCPDERVVRLVRLGKALRHHPLVLVLLQGPEHQDVASLLAAGADGIVLRASTGQELGDAVAQLRTGERAIAPALLPVLLGSMAPRNPGPGPLTPRERQVLALLAQGRTNREIAAALFLGAETVKSHLSRLYAKLEATDRHDAVSRALAMGLLG